jgi:hypothetical protein
MKKLVVLFVFATLAVWLTACSPAAIPTQAPALQSSEEKQAEKVAPPMEAPVPEAAEDAAPAEDSSRQFAATAVPLTSGGGGLTDILPQDAGRMVIKDALIDLLVKNTDRAVDDVTELAMTQGGYIISAQSWFDNDQKYANIKMAVPSANFERTLTFLRALGVKVLNETASGQDVSAEYNDLQSRLTNLEATAARVRSFLDEAKTVEDSLRINSTLTDLEGQINQIKGQMKFYEGRSAFSTIEVNLNPEQPTPTITPTPTQTPTPTPWNPGSTIMTASKRGVGMWQTIVDGLIWFCFLAWPLILVGLLVWLVIWLVRRRKTRPSVPPPTPPASPPPAE